MNRAHGKQLERLAQTREAVGVVSDLGGAAVALSMLAAALVGISSIAIGLADDRPSAVFFGCGVVVGVTIGIVLMRALRRRSARSIEMRRGYSWTRATYTYSIDPQDLHRHTQQVDVTIRALRDGVDIFSNQYRWSGSDDDSNPPMVQSPGHALHGPLRRSLGWRAYLVSLSPRLRRGEETTISVLQQLRDDGERHEPFLAKAVHERMDQLVLRVQLPPGFAPTRIWRVARDGAGPEAPEIERSQLTREDDGFGTPIEWTIADPVIGLNYELSWEYANSARLYDVETNRPGTDPPTGIA